MRSIDPTLQSKINKQNQTIYENANPKMSVVVARARSSILDASYFTIENIRTKVGITDISIATRRRKAYGVPDGLFDIYLDNGIARTSYREYPDKLKIGWQPQFNIEASKSVAICFNGHWERYRDLWQLATEQFPFIFWVDMSGKLYTQEWDNVISRDELATGVVKVKAVRGWKNINLADRDHGLIVGYIKTDGKIYYRNYCEQITGETAWENERQIEEFVGTAVNLNMFLANDYRTAFIVEDNLGKMHWIITERNWAGMALAPDTITANPVDVKIEFIPIEYIDGYIEDTLIRAVPAEITTDLRYTLTDNMFIDAYNQPVVIDEVEDWGKELIVRTQHRLYNINNADFEIVDSFNRSYYPNTVAELSDRVYKLSFIEFNNFNNVDEVGTVKFKGLFTTNGIDLLYEPFEITFYPLNLVPTEIPLPQVEVIYNE